ncbi:hypothetical protein N7492_009655 [Penicillium capsulatum]|uniref:Ubiquitin conjugating enzyme n=1 Tax=Penicillium capsulatum TaxID=69766 RepID=A0A9W9LIA7_9EURO|nr:hypothetical protein N7492_009655 [Penicillium capsulatum]KAJ6107041.1 hypothetical protein N7512_010558 [Penicillium capsulatum]
MVFLKKRPLRPLPSSLLQLLSPLFVYCFPHNLNTMSSASGVIMRRGVEVVSSHFGTSDQKPDQLESSGALVALSILTVFGMLLVMWAVEYTFGNVVATLAAVEDTNPDIYVRIDADNDDPNKPFDPNDQETGEVGRLQPITTKLRSTIKHLRARAGVWSCFRGMGMYFAWTGMRGLLSAFIPVPTSSFFGQFFAQSLISVLLSTWQMAWVHIVITEPSPKRFYQRIPSWRTWIKIAPAAAVEDVMTAAAFFLPMSVAKLAGWVQIAQGDTREDVTHFYKFLAVSALPAVLSIMISIPGRVIFVRVAASMLPEEDETIVPFDRSFGGKVNPEIVGGSGKIGIMEAWNTFDWAARVRYVKVIGKTMAIEAGLAVVAVILVGGQVILMASKSESK